MYVRTICMAAVLAAGFAPAAQADDRSRFYPYVSLESHCVGTLTDKRLAGIQVPLGSVRQSCAAIEKAFAASGTRLDVKPMRLVFDKRSGKIVRAVPF